ncbi:hypothetical protein [Alicyclobacillus cycloheptanicus]|uniref:DUF4367 domain-containing protein n=1 Tax=Alicyclobacillus cycloheptanicus TaxID=1457 RepID=A0ABT9XN22_9BACL|nr:hypothetical protein [Alicyclobacillus cycloheptanicus]MDQ0191627.1 hypothetical protein [Alicyclobacillus cycloheptanicus]
MTKDIDRFLEEISRLEFTSPLHVEDIVRRIGLRKKATIRRRWFISLTSLFCTLLLTGGLAAAGVPLDNVIGKFEHIFSKQQTGILLSISYGQQPLWDSDVEYSLEDSSYSRSIVSTLGASFPKLEYPGIALHDVDVQVYSAGHITAVANGLYSDSNITSTHPDEVSLTIYKNLDQTIYLNGQSLTGPNTETVEIEGNPVKILTFTYRGINSETQEAYYLTWIQGPWTCVLDGVGNISKSNMLQIAQSIMEDSGQR